MSVEIVGLIGMAALLVLMFLHMPIAAAMAVVGGCGLWYMMGFNQALFVLGTTAYSVGSDYLLSPLSLFTLMALIAARSGMSEDAFKAAHKWLGHLPGGIAIAAMGVCGVFAALSGTSMATAATMTTVAHPEMKKRNYSGSFSLGTICAGSQLGFMIPPSNIFIIFGFLTQVSIGKLFIAGVIPGILITVMFIATIFISALMRPGDAPAGEKSGWKDRFLSLIPVWAIAALIMLLLVGIYAGFFTPCEAAGVGAFGALVISLIKRSMTWKSFKSCVFETGHITAMVLFLIIGSMVFGSFLSVSELPNKLSLIVSGMNFPPVIIMALFLVVYIIAGFFMEIITVMVLTIPIILPVLLALQIDPVWFGVLSILTVMLGQITPPVGVLVFAVSGMVRDVPINEIFRGVMPYVIVMIIAMIVLLAFPQLSLWLPGLMM